MRVEGCRDCQQLTGGDCGKHGSGVYYGQPMFPAVAAPTVFWQKCPVCDGTGLVSRPPHIAGDQLTWSDSGAGPYQCRRCGGTGTVLTPEQGRE